MREPSQVLHTTTMHKMTRSLVCNPQLFPLLAGFVYIKKTFSFVKFSIEWVAVAYGYQGRLITLEISSYFFYLKIIDILENLVDL